MPKAVYHSGCRDQHYCPRPLTLQPPLDNCDLQRRLGVNNLPNVTLLLNSIAAGNQTHN